MPRGEYLQYGGLAIIEGVMMRSPRYCAVACRAPNGRIVLKVEAIEKTWVGRQKWLKLPFLRGSLALIDAMALGSRALRFATNIQIDPIYQPIDPNVSGANIADETSVTIPDTSEANRQKRIQDGAVVATMIVAFVLGIGLFVFLPNLIAESTSKATGHRNGTFINLVSEIIKMAFFLGYIACLGLMKGVHDTYMYHGAEHKAINTLEADQPLEMEYCTRQTRLHPRCGTSFAMIVLLLGLVVFPFVPRYPITGQQTSHTLLDVCVRVLLEVLILPVIAGVAYELLRIAGKFRNQGLVNACFKPGIWCQYITTREPEPPQIEVALTALKAVITAEDTGNVDQDEPVIVDLPTVQVA